MVKQIERERTEYLQNVARQLVAPLNAIKWHIENLTEVRVSIDRAKKVLRSIYSQATIAVHLAENFNLVSNLEADHALSKLKEPLRDISLLPLLINLADDFQPLAWDQAIKTSVDRDNFDDGPSVLAMRPLITQVFSNVIENAVKYSNPKTNVIIQGPTGRQKICVATGKDIPGGFRIECLGAGDCSRPSGATFEDAGTISCWRTLRVLRGSCGPHHSSITHGRSNAGDRGR